MARKRASMREGPLAELFRATEAAQRQEGDDAPVEEPLPPAAEADDQQTLIAAPAATEPTPPQLSRREEAALEETVEHVHDFVADADPLDEDRRRCRRSRSGRRAGRAAPAPVVAKAAPARSGAKPEPPYEPPASRFIAVDARRRAETQRRR